MAKDLDEYRSQLEAVFHQNMNSILRDPSWSVNESAGTAFLMANVAMSLAAFAMALLAPRMKDAPIAAQIDDCLTLMREVMVRKKKGAACRPGCG